MKLRLLLPFLLISAAQADVATDVVIEQPFARAAIQQQRNSAAFMTITNPGADAQIVAASSPVAEVVELHTHINDNGVMRMRKIEKIDLPSAQAVMLKPGGLHVMLLGLNRDLNIGEQIDVTLEFSDGSQKQLQVPVQKVVRPAMKHMSGQKMHDGSMPMKMSH